MQFSRRHRQGIVGKSALAALCLGLLIALIALIRFFAPDAFIALLSPLSSAGDAATKAFSRSSDAAALARENERLASENRLLINENAALRARLSEQDSVSGDGGVAAGVLLRPPLAPYDVLVVGKGSEDGVLPGAIAFSEGVPVGTVADLSPRTARVLLFSSAGRETEGWVGEERLPLRMLGKGAGAFSAEVSKEAAVAEGDVVYLPGPGAIPVGSVAKIETHPSSPVATLSIRPLVNPFSLTFVRISAYALP